MKVSVIGYCFPDYLMEVVSDGLVRLLGRENVHFDVNHAQPQDALRAPVYALMKEPNSFGLYEGDVLVCASRSGVSRVEDWIQRTWRRKVAIIDGEDDTIIRSEYLPSATAYFKRELIPGAPRYAGNIRALPFGAIPEPAPEVKKTRSVVFRGKATSQIREEIWRSLATMGFGSPEGIVSKEPYNESVASSWVGISARGAGWDTYRYWETPYLGAALLSQRLRIEIPDNFSPDAEAVFFDDVREMEGKLKSLLADLPRTRAIAEAGRRAVMERHLSIHRAKRVIEGVA